MSDLPAPLTPADCDLREFSFMPVDIVRLFGSRFHAIANDAEWRAGLTLWLKSFHQVPAGSIPDDDTELTRMSELGRDVRAWRKVKLVALHGWIKCSDGRLYHPVVCEKADEAWRRKLQQRERGRKGNEARWGNRAGGPSGDDPGGAQRRGRDDEHEIKSAPSRGGEEIAIASQAQSARDAKAILEGSPDGRKGQGHKEEGRKTGRPSVPEAASDPMHTGLVGIEPDRKTGRSMAVGWDVQTVFERCCDAAGINAATSRETWAQVIEWLQADLDADDLVRVIGKVAGRAGTPKPIRSLRFFATAVREECRPTGMLARLPA